MDRTRTAAHGRDEIRRLKAVTVPRLPFPHAGQGLQIVRRRRTVRTGKVSLERVYAVTSLTVHQATAADLAERVRGHWAIENREHHVRDVTFGEDASRVRTGNAPRAGHDPAADRPRTHVIIPGRSRERRSPGGCVRSDGRSSGVGAGVGGCAGSAARHHSACCRAMANAAYHPSVC